MNPACVYPWYAVRVRPRRERSAASALLAKGYEGFLPLYRCKRRWSDRVKEVELPLFDGYLFCKFDVSRRLPILITPNVVGIVGIGKAPLPVDEREMQNIFSIVTASASAEPFPYLQAGERVRVDRGPLRGLEGIIVAQGERARLVVTVTLLQRSVAVEIDEAWLRPLASAPRLPLIPPLGPLAASGHIAN